MRLNQLFTFASILVCFLVCTPNLQAQSGDQILDGIGETALISRYVFDGNSRDWSRNNLHAEIHGKKVEFIKDDQFGTVLSLPGIKENFVSIPAGAVKGVESLSLTGWIFLRSVKKDQRMFDFGGGPEKSFSAAPLGAGDNKGFVAQITTGKKGHSSVSEEIALDQWVHLAIVFDLPEQNLRTYVDGELVEQTDIRLELDEVFNGKNKLFLGKSLRKNAPFLNAKLHDFRIFRTPLNEGQIERIYKNALGVEDQEGEEYSEEIAEEKRQFSESEPPLYAAYLKEVPDITLETTVGHLPRLPRYIEGVYEQDFDGPEVRVLWPSPAENSSVLEPGRYTITGEVAGTDFRPMATVTVIEGNPTPAPMRNLEVFKLEQVELNPDSKGEATKFMENRDKFVNTLAGTNPDSFLYMFRNAFGQEQPEGATPLGVWDSQETKLRGHATGHYLTALAQAYASTGYADTLQSNFAEKMEYMVNTLYDLSKMSGRPTKAGGEYVADPRRVPKGPGKSEFNSDLNEEEIRTDYWNWGEGYISAYPPDQFIMLENGASYGGQEDQVWAPYYTLHKILAGLMDIYEVSGNEKALEVAKGMSDWVYLRLNELPTETLISMWNTYIAGEYGGMNEAMARLYRITNQERYLKGGQLFDNIKVFFGDSQHTHGLAKNIDSFRSLHSNQHIPQILGALETYRGSENPEYYRVAENFWYKATNDYMYSIGGVAGARNPENAECFTAEPATLYQNGFSTGGQNETCATYNMLKLTRNLFLYDQQSALMDYYERGLYNHILASVAEDSPANTYHVPLNPGSVKRFGNADMTGFTCCNGTALESHTKLQNSIYFKTQDNNGLFINLFVPSTLHWKEQNITLEQSTAFPYEDKTRLKFNGDGKFDLNIRVPHWATKGFEVEINGEVQQVDAEPGKYLTLNRHWKTGDVVELHMPFQFYLDPVMDQPNLASLFYGPVLLAAEEAGPRTTWREVSFDPKNIERSIEGNPEELRFTIDGTVFKPFFNTYGRHSVYLDVSPK